MTSPSARRGHTDTRAGDVCDNVATKHRSCTAPGRASVHNIATGCTPCADQARPIQRSRVASRAAAAAVQTITSQAQPIGSCCQISLDNAYCRLARTPRAADGLSRACTDDDLLMLHICCTKPIPRPVPRHSYPLLRRPHRCTPPVRECRYRLRGDQCAGLG